MEEKDFTIRDRRSSASEDTDKSEPQPSDRPGATGRQETAPPFEIDFSSFILSLATTVQVSLGAIPNPETNLQAHNLPAAKQMIDIISMLKEKTNGNLSSEEQAMIDSILYNLRMHYIRALEGKK